MSSDGLHAEQSCISCRRLKRKCTKDLPRCGLCSRVGRMCEYQTPPPTPGRSNLSGEGPSGRLTDPPRFGEAPRAFSGIYSTLVRPEEASKHKLPPSRERHGLNTFFLDSVATRGADLTVPTDLEWKDVSSDVAALSIDEARAAAEMYFATTHEWLPIVSKMRVLRTLQSGGPISTADTQVLFQAMCLTFEPSSEERSARYRSTKLALIIMEQYGQWSTAYLAAYTLLAMFEVGQALYPSAYLTVSNVGRIFYASGFHNRKKSTQLLGKPDTWTEAEERRRLWWAVLMLDRYVHISFRFRPLSTPSIPPDEILPSSDVDWDIGELAVNPLLVMSIEAATKVSPYARTCQSAHLLGRVCEHVNEHTTASDVDFHFQEASSISRALLALTAMLHEESQKARERSYLYFSARALCYAALGALYDVHACIEIDDIESIGGNRGLRLDIQQLAIDGYKKVSAYVLQFAHDLEQHMRSGGPGKVGPIVCDCLNFGAGTFAWYARENGGEDHLVALADIRRTLDLLSSKWSVATDYVKLLEGQEYSYEGACTQ